MFGSRCPSPLFLEAVHAPRPRCVHASVPGPQFRRCGHVVITPRGPLAVGPHGARCPRRRSDGRDQDRRLVQSCRLDRKKTAVTNAINLRTCWVRKSERRWVRFRERRGGAAAVAKRASLQASRAWSALRIDGCYLRGSSSVVRLGTIAPPSRRACGSQWAHGDTNIDCNHTGIP
jgi:hypothetical protein